MSRKDTLDKALTDNLREIVDFIKSSKKLVKAEMPTIVKEILLSAKLKLALSTIIAFKLMFVCILFFWLYPIGPSFVSGFATGIAILCGFLGVITWGVCWYEAVDIFFAPKTFIVKEIKKLIRE